MLFQFLLNYALYFGSHSSDLKIALIRQTTMQHRLNLLVIILIALLAMRDSV
jgi:hypothetical protein